MSSLKFIATTNVAKNKTIKELINDLKNGTIVLDLKSLIRASILTKNNNPLDILDVLYASIDDNEFEVVEYLISERTVSQDYLNKSLEYAVIENKLEMVTSLWSEHYR